MNFIRFKKNFWIVFISVLSFILAAGCAGKKPAETSVESPSTPVVEEENILGDSDSGKAAGLQTIHFAYDSFVLDSGTKTILDSNAKILKEKSTVKIQIEGHCDQRGGIQYNIALGEKRAHAVKKYLEDVGLPEARISTISYGKERLLDPSNAEEAFAKNRRANFVVTSK